jgi:hypothetical protein
MKLVIALAALALSASAAFAGGGYYGSTRIIYDDPDLYDPVPTVVVTRRVIYAPPRIHHHHRPAYRRIAYAPRPMPYGYGRHYGHDLGGWYGVRRAYHGPGGHYWSGRAVHW